MSTRLFIFVDDLAQETFDVAYHNEREKPQFKHQSLESITTANEEPFEETIIVLTNSAISEHALHLPSLKFAEKTIPNALEDRLISPIETLHFAFDAKITIDRLYRVNVIAKDYLKALLKHLNEINIFPTVVTSANANEANFCYLTHNQAYFNDPNCVGAVSNAFLEKALKAFKTSEIRTFTNSNAELLKVLEAQKGVKRTAFKLSYLEYFCLNYSPTKQINLMQGEFEPKKRALHQKKWFNYSLIAVSVSLTLCLITFFSQLFILSKQSSDLNKQIATLYFKLFPGATSIVSPKFRIQQLLDDNQGDGGHGFLAVLEKTAPKLYKTEGLTVKNLKYQSNRLTLTLSINSFTNLNALITALQNEGLTVTQQAANSVGKTINAVIEVQS